MKDFMVRKKIVLVLFIVLLSVVFIVFHIFSEQVNKEISLEKMYKSMSKLTESNEFGKIYDQFLLPSEKIKISRDEFIRKYSRKNISIYSEDYKVHSVVVSGDRGVVDRTIILCLSKACDGENKLESRMKFEYFYINGKWYAPIDNQVYCERTEEYVYPEEFKRAVSLLIQRKENSKLNESIKLAVGYKKVRNCLDIQYLSGKENFTDVEGVFVFDNSSTPERLQIFVSPKYQNKDDLLTTLLLSHEIHHAYLFAAGKAKFMTCYENESEAFATELGLYHFDFNQEEKDSINNRYYTSNEVKAFLDLYRVVNNRHADYISDGVLPIIMENPIYQKQCE